MDHRTSTHFAVHMGNGQTRDVHYPEPCTMDDVLDRFNEEFGSGNVAGVTILCASTNAQPPEFEGDAFCMLPLDHTGPHDDDPEGYLR